MTVTANPFPALPVLQAEFQTQAVIKPTGFREYDVRWWFGHEKSDKAPEINLMGVQHLGRALGTLMHEIKTNNKAHTPHKIIVAHDYRSYSLSIKHSLCLGLIEAGMHVIDIGLAISPMAYFAQNYLNIDNVAMVTASHNENGWTGVKMGAQAPLTFGPEETTRLQEICLQDKIKPRAGGGYAFQDGVRQAYLNDLQNTPALTQSLKIVCACGNGTAGNFAPNVLRAIGVEVIEVECALDYNFPHYNPNPESLAMLSAMREAVLTHKADMALGFDGDGDRCGVVDNEGNFIYADKMGVLIARTLSMQYPNAHFIADVKSTSIFTQDEILRQNGATTSYWKTGHSYMKRRCHEKKALAGFEKSGHYFFNAPIGRGYDDGILTALHIIGMLAKAKEQTPQCTLADLYRTLPQTWSSPTMSPACADEEKYAVMEHIQTYYANLFNENGEVAGQTIKEILTINGVRFVLPNGSWGLIRASSNTPNLVVVVESTVSDAHKNAIFAHITNHLSTYVEIGAFDQKMH